MSAAGSAGLEPPLRRYWLCASAALEALGAAIDPPDWEDPALPMTIVALDAKAHAVSEKLAATADHVRLVDASDSDDFPGLIERLIAGDHATHIQLCLNAVADFGPSIELLEQRLQRDEVPMIRGEIAEIGEVATRLGSTDLAIGVTAAPEAVWIETGLLRRALAETPLDDPGRTPLERLLAQAAHITPRVETTKLILGARFVVSSENVAEAPVSDALRWRARTARAFARTDWLEVDRRHRWLRELAVRRKMEKRGERERARLRQEIDVLHAKLAAPWSAARLRLRSEQVRRSRLLKALRPWK